MSSNDPSLAAVDINNMSVASEEMPSLADYGREPSTGAWPDGWYPTVILAGYATNSGFQWATEDTPSKDGMSRNLRVCFKMTNKAKEERNIWGSFNYRLADFTADRLAAIARVRKQAQAENWKPGAWPGELKDLQRSNLAVSTLGQFERALGFKLKLIPGTGLNASIFVGHQLDIRIAVNPESNFSEVKEYAKLGERKTLYK
jgi:hypothetical protein